MAAFDAELIDKWKAGERVNLRRAMQRHEQLSSMIPGLASCADLLLSAGLVYRVGLAQGEEPGNIAADLGRRLWMLQRARRLVEFYGEVTRDELERALLLAVARGKLDSFSIDDALFRESALITLMHPDGAVSEALDDVINQASDGGCPDEDYVAFNVIHHWTRCISKRSVVEIASDMAAAFLPGQIAVQTIKGLLADHSRKHFSPWLARDVTAEAIVRAKRGPAVAVQPGRYDRNS